MNRTSRLLSLGFALSALVFAGCSTAPKPQHGAVHWTYDGHTGPAHWTGLSGENWACGGLHQSPIDLADAVPVRTALDFDYRPTALNLVNNGHTIQQNVEAGSWLRVGDDVYALKQFHMHTPSEHTVGGKVYDLELHLVHQNEAGQLAVVGVLFERGATNAFLETFWRHLPVTPNERHGDPAVQLDVRSFLPASGACFAYEGSLTTPPCTEGVRWMVLETPVQLAPSQLDAFRAIYAHNARPVQPRNNRVISRFEP
jgi:carbonic anhydrase